MSKKKKGNVSGWVSAATQIAAIGERRDPLRRSKKGKVARNVLKALSRKKRA